MSMKARNNRTAETDPTGRYRNHICRAANAVTNPSIAPRFRGSRPRDRYEPAANTSGTRDLEEERLLINFMNEVIESLGERDEPVTGVTNSPAA